MHVSFIVGRAGSDPQPIGQSGCRFSIATDDWNGATKQRETTWSRCVAFGKTADTANKYVTKGRMVAVRARYQVREYVDSNGVKQQDHGFIIDHLELLPDGKNQAQPQQGPGEASLW